MRLNKYVWLMLILSSLSGVSHAALKVNLSETHVQSVLQNYFPIKEYAAVARVTLREPKVQFNNDKYIVLIIPVDANMIGGGLSQGHVVVMASLNYKATTGGLYLSNPRIAQYESPGVDNKVLVELQGLVEAIIKNSLPLVRIYKVKEDDLNHSLAKSALKKVFFESRRLSLEFGFK